MISLRARKDGRERWDSIDSRMGSKSLLEHKQKQRVFRGEGVTTKSGFNQKEISERGDVGERAV